MKNLTILLLGACALAHIAGAADWPVVRSFDKGHLYRVALPMGGIGTGSVSLSGRGELCDWEIMNRPNKGQLNGECNGIGRSFFAVRAKGAKTSVARMLAGPIDEWEYLQSEGWPVPQAGLPRFGEASFDGAFPFGVVHLGDPAVPLKVDIRGFSPFIPGDSAASSLPVASLEYVVENTSDEPLEVSVVGFVRNIVGNNGYPNKELSWKSFSHSGGEKDNRTSRREAEGLRGVLCWSQGVATNNEAWGSFALVTPDADGSVTYRENCTPNSWENSILDFWDDFTDDGALSPRPAGNGALPHGGLCVKKTVPARSKASFRFAYTWTFPNRYAWSGTPVGNWYSQFYKDGWDAALKIVPRLPELERRTLAFVRGVLAEDVPAEIKEAALSNLAVLKSQTVFRVPTGHFMGWEGSFDHIGSCGGSCTHVWNYENAVADLFPDLARSMRDVEFNYAMDPATGRMDFRVQLPLGVKRTGAIAADGQMGCIMKVYRDWRICGDDAWLKALWPKVRKALEFAWTEWDADRDGLMEGSQHNTMDVNYWGPNPQMQFWYMGALRAAEEMAKAAGDPEFARACREIFAKASKGTDGQLFNGDYYEHKIRAGHENDSFQLGPGCLVDQLVGQQMAHLWDLGDLAEPAHLRKTCESILRWNWKGDFSDHFNNDRVYCAGHEAGLLMASWPKGRLKVPFPYFAEVMTGFEYVAATEMIFQGMEADALRVIKAIRDRHDGLKRNPYSEPECGHNYARSMASWNCLLAWRKAHGGKVR